MHVDRSDPDYMCNKWNVSGMENCAFNIFNSRFFVCWTVVSKGDLLQVIVAEDLFKAVVRDPQHLLLRASYKAARAWAGQEEVARGLMMNFLFDACPAAHYFIQASATSRPGQFACRSGRSFGVVSVVNVLCIVELLWMLGS